MSRYYSLETIRANAKDVTLANRAKHRCIDPDALLDIEPADVRENVKGEWTEEEHTDEKCIEEWQSARCSVCGKYLTTPYMYYFNDYNFCPNCGADMRGEA